MSNKKRNSAGGLVYPIANLWETVESMLSNVPFYNLNTQQMEIKIDGVFVPLVTSTPVNTVAPIISGIGYVGETLTAIAGTWNNADSVSGQWYADGSPIIGATGLTYDVTLETEGSSFSYVETAQPNDVIASSNIIHNWAPEDDEPNTSFWFDPVRTSTITLGVAPNVERWYSAKSNSVFAQQFTTGQQPTLSASAINGLDAIVFDNVNDVLNASGPTPDVTLGSNLSIHWVGSHPSVGAVNFGSFFNHVNATDDRGVQVGRLGTGVDARIQIRNSSGAPINCTGTNAFDGQVNVYSALVHTSRGLIELLKNGLSIGTLPFTGLFELNRTFVNFGQLGGTVGEVLMVSNKPYNVDDVFKAVGYLAHRWGINDKLSALHPYRNNAPTIAGGIDIGEMTLFGSYGQSWAAENGNNGALASLLTPQNPDNNFMISPPAGIVTDVSTETSFESMYEAKSTVQSVTGPMSLRYYDELLTGLYLARQDAEGGKSLEELARSDMSFYDGVSPFYADMLATLNKLKSIGETYYKTINYKYLYWCQGVNNFGDSEAVYTPKFIEMLNGLSDDSFSIFGNRPKFMIVVQPGGTAGGRQPNILAQTTVALDRADTLLAYAGWAVEKHTDGLHFSTDGCVDLGEVLALKAQAWDSGTKWHSPYFINAQRVGTTITLEVAGPYDVVADETVNTPSHYVSGVPVDNLGFEHSATTINSVVVTGRLITIELASAVSGLLRFAYSNTARGDGYVINRGNIRSVWTGLSTYTGNTLYDWAVSGEWSL